MTPCLFCSREEYEAPRETDYICSGCVQTLLSISQDKLRRGRALAVEKGYPHKAAAMESFLIPEGQNGKQFNSKRKSRHVGKHFERRGNTKANRFKKITARGLAKQTRLSVPEDQQELSTVS